MNTTTHAFQRTSLAGEPATQTHSGLDLLVLKSRLTATARCLLETMGVEINEVPWRGIVGPAVYHLSSPIPDPRVYWIGPAKVEELVEALKQDEDLFRGPQWLHSFLRNYRAGTLFDLDGGLDFGNEGMGVSQVMHDLLRCPGN